MAVSIYVADKIQSPSQPPSPMPATTAGRRFFWS
jgi:hypothetical protein